MRERPQLHRAAIGSDLLRMRDARRWLVRLVLEAGFAPADAHDLAVAFGETCANIHRHAFGGRRNGSVELRVAIELDRVEVTLEHDGEPFDPAAYAPPDLRRPSDNGYGLYLITSLVDDVSFESANSGGRVVLIKRKRASELRGERVDREGVDVEE